MTSLLPTIALNLLVMAAMMAAVHRALRWSAAAIERTRVQTSAPAFTLVETVDRRTQELPFVGQDRRKVEEAVQAEIAQRNGTDGAPTASNVKAFKRR